MIPAAIAGVRDSYSFGEPVHLVGIDVGNVGGSGGINLDGSISSAEHSGQLGFLVGKRYGRFLFLRLRFAILS